ncbi:MAG: hypothetical protein JXA93_01055 [Anaerolineae bacterium]|nr:hypothetical protein [Anaerolineae bacterium]
MDPPFDLVPDAWVRTLSGGGAPWVKTNEIAAYLLPGVPAGSARVWATAEGYKAGIRTVNVKANKIAIALPIFLEANTYCAVRAANESGIEFDGCNPPQNPPTCPSSGGVILFKHENYDCGGGEYGSGYVRLDNPGVYNDVGADFNDQASSVRVPAGWSVKLYQHENGTGGSACRSGDDPNFWGDYFNNGVTLNDNITSFRVYNVPDCGHNSAPAKPSPSSPANGYVAQDGKAPTLCWNRAVDPEGNEVEYYAEVYNSPVNANSGWIHETCWRPASLDGDYHTYNWHVKARDLPRQAQSGWSATRTFSIEPPNQPPSIAFTTANGSAIPSSRSIDSNVRGWTFAGTAADSDGQVTKIEYRCTGDGCGSYTSQSGLNTWTHTRSSMAGRNDIHFRAYDDDGAVTPSQHLNLRIDLQPPITTLALNGATNAAKWPTWFPTVPVQVRLQASDQATGHARAGVKEIHYRLDGGAWQTRTGADTNFPVSSDGTHTVEYYARDKVGNQEATRQATFKIDATPPGAPGTVTETHGAVSDEWQRDWSDPAFTWVPATDATSGVRYYRVDWNGTLQVVTTAAYDPPAVRTGTYQLSARAVDWAGHVGPTGALFTFKYDGTPPRSPAVHNNDQVASGVWQNQVRTADFSWPEVVDEGSGIAGYHVYWGPEPAGISDTLRVEPGFVYSTPICAEDEAQVYYLRARSQDNVGWQSPWVDYALAYDGAPPTATVIANYGLTVTHQTDIHLSILSDDEGSGVVQMRLSNDGSRWADWTDILTETLWQIPALGRRTHTVYLQVADAAGNLSSVVSDTVYLDVNPPRPQSDNYWLWNNQMASGSGVITSTNYNAHATVGQSTNTQVAASPNYLLQTGFEAGAQAAPVVQPTYITYTQTGSVMAGGGTGATALQSSDHKMWGTLGQPAHVRTITSTNYVMLSGFWGGTGYDLQPPPPPPPPPPAPEPECEFYSVEINDDAPFTNSPEVTLTLCGPDPVEVMLSNTGEFSATVWQPYTQTISWTLQISGTSVQPRFVHARFKDSSGAVYGDFVDDIVYDPNAWGGEAVFDLTELLTGTQQAQGATIEVEGEKGSVTLHVINEDTVDLYLSANDDSSGLEGIQVSEYPDFVGTEWEPYAAIVPLTFDGEDGIKTLHVRFRDNAGNISEPADASIMVDTTPPLGGIALGDQIVGPAFLTVTAYFGAIDDLSGVADMRVGQDPTLADAVWQPYTWTLALPISLTTETEGVLYAQYRDVSGNVSETTSDTFVVDTTPPLVYAKVAPGDTLTRAVTVLAYDELVDVATVYLSNDPLMIEGVVTLAYTEVVTWTFDEREVVWVQVEDSVGNASEPYPAYAGAQLLSSELALAPGWNLISWPLAPVSTNLTDTLSLLGGTCDAAWTYDAWDSTDPWKEWPGDLAEVDETAGLWLHATEPVTLTLSGWYPAGAAVELRQGWNLVGYPSPVPHTVEEALASIAGKFTRIQTYDPTDAADPWKEYNVDAPAYANDLAMIEPERGYWIYVTEDCTWLVPQ